MSKRSYNQYCSVARALDVVGERWTLLLVRELLTGPKRYKDLLEGLPRIGTNLLAARLKDLEEGGVVRRATLPPPAGSHVYELTALGWSLEPVVVALSRWGARLLDVPPRSDEDLRPAWAAMAVRGALEPLEDEEVRETYEFHIDDEAFHVRVGDGGIEARQGPAGEADLVLRGDTQTFLAVAAGHLKPSQAVVSGGIQVQGDQDALERCLEMLGLAAS